MFILFFMNELFQVLFFKLNEIFIYFINVILFQITRLSLDLLKLVWK